MCLTIKKKIFEILLIFLVILSSCLPLNDFKKVQNSKSSQNNALIEDKNKQPKISYNWNLDFIHITGTNWTQTNSTYAWCNGKGTEDKPYIIENVTIDAGGTGSCIVIENSTNVHFEIRNCILYNSGGISDKGSGIRLINVSHGNINNNKAFDNRYGLSFDDCRNNRISYNNLSYCSDGFIPQQFCI